MKYSIGTNLDNKLIILISRLLNKYNVSKNNITFYGSYYGNNLSLDRSIKGCDNQIGLDYFLKHIKLIKKNGFLFKFVINNPNFSLKKNKEELDYYLKIFYENNINYLTIYDKDIISYINKNYKNKFKISVSTINRIYSIEELNNFLKVGEKVIDNVIFSHSINYDLQQIKKVIKICKKKGVEAELIGNELLKCKPSCFTCDVYTTDINYSKKAEYCCGMENRIKEPHNSNLIRPEEIFIYKELGIDCIKLGTRYTSTKRIIRIINSYLKEKHEGSFYYLLGDQYDGLCTNLNNRLLDGKMQNLINYKKLKNTLK